MRAILVVLLLAFCATTFAEETVAFCPVSGDKFIVAANQSVTFIGGQKIYTCCDGCTRKLNANPVNYFRAPTDPTYDFIPNMTNQTVVCPVCGDKIVVNGKTPRQQFKHGQSLFFACYGCINKFLKNPMAYIQA